MQIKIQLLKYDLNKVYFIRTYNLIYTQSFLSNLFHMTHEVLNSKRNISFNGRRQTNPYQYIRAGKTSGFLNLAEKVSLKGL